LRRAGRGFAFRSEKGASRVDFPSNGGLSWRETEPGKGEGKYAASDDQMRMYHKAPIEPKDVHVIINY
jgi:hypothetical protein